MPKRSPPAQLDQAASSISPVIVLVGVRRQRPRSPSRSTCRPARWSRRCMIGDELLATKYPYGYSTASLPSFITLPEHAAHPRRAAGARRRRGVPLAGRPLADLGQARHRPARRPHRDARGPRLHQRPTRSGCKPDGTGQAENEDGSLAPAARFIETLPGARQPHDLQAHGRSMPLDNMAEIVVPPEPSVRDGRQPRQLGRQPRAGARRRRRHAADRPIWSVASTGWSGPGISA